MKTHQVYCPACKVTGPHDCLDATEVERLRHFAGVFLSLPDGWIAAATHCGACDHVRFILAPRDVLPREVYWPGADYFTPKRRPKV